MLVGPMSNAQLRRGFEAVLRDVLSGVTHVPEGTGLDEKTNAALNTLAQDPDHPATKILAARNEFARQVTGEHTRQDYADLLAK